MKKLNIKKDALKGQNLFNKLFMYSLFTLEFPMIILVNYTIDHPAYGIAIFAGIAAWFLVLVYVNKIKENKVLKNESGKRFIAGDADHGNGYCDEYEFKIRGEIYTMDDANEYVKKRLKIAELENAKITLKKYERAQKDDPLSYPFDKPLLTFEQIEDLQYYAGLEFGSDTRITRKATTKYIGDKVIENWYAKAMNQSPLEQDPGTKEMIPTKEYLQWRHTMAKVENFLNAQIQQQLNILQKDKRKVKPYQYTLIAETIARTFSKYQIKCAIDNRTDGKSLLAWLQRFEDSRDLLEKQFILEKALEMSESNNLPQFCMVMEPTRLENMVKNIVPVEETHFKHEPHLPFKLVVVYADRPLENSVLWKEVKRKRLGYSDIPQIGAKANINVLGRATHDLPMVVLAHAPGKGYTRPYMDYSLDEIKKEKEIVNKEQINQLLGENLELREKSDSLEVYEKAWRRIASKFKGALGSTFEQNADEFIEEVKQEHAAKQKALSATKSKPMPKKWKRIVLIISVLGSITIVIILLFALFSPAPAAPTLLSSLFS